MQIMQILLKTGVEPYRSNMFTQIMQIMQILLKTGVEPYRSNITPSIMKKLTHA